MEERKYAYMIKRFSNDWYGIMYHLGKYNVGWFRVRDNGMIFSTDRSYKTLSGAENRLLKDYSYSKRNAPEVLYGTADFIKKGSYWKGE